MKSSVNTIIWDWNGTLLDDVSICLESINSMLEERRLGKLTFKSYRNVFTFPVIDYYREVGFDFDKEDWEEVAMGFMERYFDKLPVCSLFPDAINVLGYLQDRGYRQVILSAMEQNALLSSVNERGIAAYFQKIVGIDNHYAAGKSGNGHAIISEYGISAENSWFIGDTLHDAEIARELGCRCMLIANGHQDRKRLETAGVTVLKDISELPLLL
jgi:phosphoglycolate phosphatase